MSSRVTFNARLLALPPALLTILVVWGQHDKRVAHTPVIDTKLMYLPARAALAQQAIDAAELARRSGGLPLRLFQAHYKIQPQVNFPADLIISHTIKAGLKLVVAPDGQVIRVEVMQSSGIPKLDRLLLEACAAAVFEPLNMPGNPSAFIFYQPFEIEPPADNVGQPLPLG